MDPLKFKMGWLIVAFDLPVKQDWEKRRYVDFRRFLLGDGYQMIQYSVYARSAVTFSRLQTHIRRLKDNIPPEGNVRAWHITQAQWERSVVIHGKPAKKADPESLPDQLLFW